MAILMLVASGLLAACGATTAPRASKTGTSSTTTSSAPMGKAAGKAGYLVPAGPGSTTLPTEDALTPVHSGFETGQEVAITTSGFEPSQLSGHIDKAVVWTNDSGRPQRITIPVASIRSPIIPPGAQFVWMPSFGGYLTYTSASGFRATLILQ